MFSFFKTFDELEELEKKVSTLEKVSGYSLQTLIELFLKGYTLEPTHYKSIGESVKEFEEWAREISEST